MASLPPNEEEDGWMYRGGAKRSRENVEDEESEGNDDDMQALRRARSEENPKSEEPCTKMARLPSTSSPPTLSCSSWPCLSSTQAAPTSESATPIPSMQDAVQSTMTHGFKSCGLPEPATNEVFSQRPLAPCLVDYCAPGGTTRYLPRPEWVAPVRRKRPRAVGTQSPEASHVAALSNEFRTSPVVPPPALAAVPENVQDEISNSDSNGQDGSNAPNDGLLPDHLFDAFSSPQRRARQLQRSMVAASSRPNNSETEQGTAYINATNAVPVASKVAEQETIDLTASATIPKDATPVTPPLAVFGKDNDTALHYAIRENASEAALDLMNNGASVHADNSKGVTPLVLASQKGNFAVAKALVQRGASPLAASITGCTSLLQAAHFGRANVVKLLLQHGARIELANYKNTTPLMRAAQEGHDEIVKILLENGAMVNRKNNEQMSALMLASQRGHASIVQRLVDAKAEINAMTAQNSTALMLACKREHVPVVKVLVTSGCELQLRDSRGRTARDMAQRKNSKEMLRLLSPTMQIELMRRESRRQRNHVMIQMWLLLQQERAFLPVPDEDHIATDHCTMMTIHQISDHPNKTQMLSRTRMGTNALVRAMTLPAPLLEHIATFMPLPHLWNRRIGLITKRCGIDADSSVSCALDLIDEVLEEGGFVEACDAAGVTPPPHFKNWGEWKSWGKRFDGVNGSPAEQRNADRPSATNSTLSALLYTSTAAAAVPASSPSLIRNNQNNPQQGPSDHCNDRPRASSVELRRDVCFLQLLAYRSPMLTRTLAAPPYNMPSVLIQQLKNVNDIQSLVRRMGSRGIHFDANVAIELVMLAGTVTLWYAREREDR